MSNPQDLNRDNAPTARRSKAIAAAAALALLAAACGSSADTTATTAADAVVEQIPESLADADEEAMEDEAMEDEDEAMEDDDEAMEDEAMEDDADYDEAMEDDSDSAVATATGDLGDFLVDAGGYTLYGFTQDSPTQSVCNDDCATAWPPLTVDGDTVPEGLDTEVFSVIVRDDGTYQLAAGNWPLYTFANDEVVGDTNGQGVNDVWFVVTPDGQLVTEAPEAEAEVEAASASY